MGGVPYVVGPCGPSGSPSLRPLADVLLEAKSVTSSSKGVGPPSGSVSSPPPATASAVSPRLPLAPQSSAQLTPIVMIGGPSRAGAGPPAAGFSPIPAHPDTIGSYDGGVEASEQYDSVPLSECQQPSRYLEIVRKLRALDVAAVTVKRGRTPRSRTLQVRCIIRLAYHLVKSTYKYMFDR